MPAASPRTDKNSTATETVAEVMPARMAAAANGEVAVPTTRFDDDALLGIQSFDDAAALLAENDIPVVAADQVIGNGFAIVNDKGFLCGVPMMLLSWHFNSGDNGQFVSINAVCKLPGNTLGKYIINDGSTGIYEQLRKYTEKTSKTAGLIVKRGLRRSDYQYTDKNDGTTKNATTFYLDTSA